MAWFFHAILCCFENRDFQRQFSSHSPMTIRSSRKRLRRASEKPGFSRASEKYATVQQKVTAIFSTSFAISILIKPSVSAPERIRTTNLLIRSQMLYPVELRAPKSAFTYERTVQMQH